MPSPYHIDLVRLTYGDQPMMNCAMPLIEKDEQPQDKPPDEKPLHHEPTLVDHLRQAIATINQEDQTGA